MAIRRAGAILVAALLAETVIGGEPAASPDYPVIPAPRANFLERCGGCHGVDGESEMRAVPTLLAQAGWFLCLPEGRRYLIQLPNVARVALDDEEVAAMMNYVAFDLGGASKARHAPYTAREVGELRKAPLVAVSLTRLRKQLLERMDKECGAPSSLSGYEGPTVDERNWELSRVSPDLPRTADISLASQRRN